MKIDHIGYLVADINKGISIFQALGYKMVTDIIKDDIEYDGRKSRMVYLCFLENNGTRVELVSPIDDTSDVNNTIKRQGDGPYHICYRTDDLDKQISQLKEQSWIVIKKPENAVAFNMSKVAFLYRKGVGLIELVETAEGNK